MVQTAEERRLRKNAQAKAKYHGDSKFRTDKNATAKARYHGSSTVRANKIATVQVWKKDNSAHYNAQQADYRATPNGQALQKKRTKDERMRYYEKHGHHRDSDWNKYL